MYPQPLVIFALQCRSHLQRTRFMQPYDGAEHSFNALFLSRHLMRIVELRKIECNAQAMM